MLRAGQANITSFRVVPNIPEKLKPLLEIAHNFWWTWHPEAVELFQRIDRELWEQSNHNPVLMLGRVDQASLDNAAQDRSFLHALNTAHARFTQHLERECWHHRAQKDLAATAGKPGAHRIAYFSAEFGLTECFQIYSGGLGLLAGDHLKSASELGLPLCAVGLLYRCGYFHQYLNADGWQQETYPDLDFPNQPIKRLIDPATAEQFRVTVELPGRTVTVGIWQADVGRIPLYLLDTNFPENDREDRDITKNLYGGDVEHRMQQEIILGIGGIRALEKIGEKPTVFHINEGHAAFLALERIAKLREQHDVSFQEARRAAASAHVFTTHTPVPAGIDRFSPDLVETYFSPYFHRLAVSRDEFMGMGKSNPFDPNEFFSMAVLALRTANAANGVSKLHGVISRDMWKDVWPGLPAEEVPIKHVTNGVHARSWIAPSLMRIYDRYLGPDWQLDPRDERIFEAIDDIPDEELWSFHIRQREKLVVWSRKRIREQLTNRGAGIEEIEHATAALDPHALTIGFARRFATYKRAVLLLEDMDRLRKLFNDEDKPIQFIIAGKSHPADGPGKELIRTIVKLADESDHLNRIVFLEDYDIDVARRMVQGCDIWLNTPRRGMEASGTSGMKAAMNGAVNVSILDGWWDEAYEPELGFAIGKRESYESEQDEDTVESRALYDLLERRIIPEFFDCDSAGIPRKWVARMKATMKRLTPFFSSNRMVGEYAEQFYEPAHHLAQKLNENNLKNAKHLAANINNWRMHWHEISVGDVIADVAGPVPVDTAVNVRAQVHLGPLSPDEVKVQLYHGQVDALGDLKSAAAIDMHHNSGDGSNHTFAGTFKASLSGRRGFTVRVLPNDDRLGNTIIPGLITWRNGSADEPNKRPFSQAEIEPASV
jgi:starch phosphorylase